MLIISILNRNRKGNIGERATMHFAQTAPSSQHRSSGSRWACPILPERAVNCHRHLHHRSLKSQWHSQADGRRDYPTKQPPHVHGDDLPKAIRKLANTWSPADILYPQKFNQQPGLYPQCILSSVGTCTWGAWGEPCTSTPMARFTLVQQNTYLLWIREARWGHDGASWCHSHKGGL